MVVISAVNVVGASKLGSKTSARGHFLGADDFVCRGSGDNGGGWLDL